ncbi:hypothetical protein ACWAUC_11190 [Bradyrhizobium guangdongense]
MNHPHNWLFVASIMWTMLIGCALIYMVAFQGYPHQLFVRIEDRNCTHSPSAYPRAIAQNSRAAASTLSG